MLTRWVPSGFQKKYSNILTKRKRENWKISEIMEVVCFMTSIISLNMPNTGKNLSAGYALKK
jgi:hypothetical protein